MNMTEFIIYAIVLSLGAILMIVTVSICILKVLQFI